MGLPVGARVALVTGASRGLGADVARALGRAGYRVVVAYHEDSAAAGSVASDIGAGAWTVQVDIASAGEVEALAADVGKREGRLDLLINNAGITTDSLLVRTTEEDWDRVLSVNLLGSAFMARAFSPLLKSSGCGHIVNVSSRSGMKGRAGQAAYASSKAALLGLTMTQAREFADSNIRVNAIAPGYMATDMGRASEAAMEQAREESLLGTLADPKEAASFIVWLASTTNITGQVFALDSRPSGW